MKLSQSRKDWLGRMTAQYQAARPTWVDSYLSARGISPQVADTYRLGYVDEPDPQHEMFTGRLAIPFITPTGVVAIRFRCLEDHACHDPDTGGCGSKYMGPKGENTHLYNVQALHDAEGFVAVTEGELDAAVSSVCGIPAVGVPGSNNWKPHYRRLFEDFDKVLILGDGDKAGRDFTSKLLTALPNAESRTLPAGYDVSSYLLEYSDEEFIDHCLG